MGKRSGQAVGRQDDGTNLVDAGERQPPHQLHVGF